MADHRRGYSRLTIPRRSTTHVLSCAVARAHVAPLDAMATDQAIADPDEEATLDISVLRTVIAMQHELATVGLDLKAVMQRIADRTRELIGGTAAAVRLLDG